MPSLPLCAPLQELSYTVQSNHDRRQRLMLLSGVSAVLVPGEMSALVGGRQQLPAP